ncbi:hypothetical protein LTR53_004220 [Teratosphaeriaceae sp. CCFEE 6253]|nr:hypothetical protein LTR53_004220 [Teratosphaeriaceae sp. CCFEE 6253]
MSTPRLGKTKPPGSARKPQPQQRLITQDSALGKPAACWLPSNRIAKTDPYNNGEPLPFAAKDDADAIADVREPMELAGSDEEMSDEETFEGGSGMGRPAISSDQETLDTRLGRGMITVLFDEIETHPDRPYHEHMQARVMFELQDSDDEQEVGVVVLHIINKTETGPRGDRSWTEGLLRGGVEGDLACTSAALRAFYSPGGSVLKDFQAFVSPLNAGSVIHLRHLELWKGWQGMGFGQAVMRLIERMLRTRLGDESATVLLQPDMLDNDQYEETDRPEVQGRLLRFYGSLGYRVWFEDEPGVPGSYMLMGKKL